MSRPRINVSDNEKWGRLVKTWATGKNYVDFTPTNADPFPTAEQAPPKYPKPTSFKDLVQQCTRAGVTLFFEGAPHAPIDENEPLGFVLVQTTSDSYVLRLPPKDKIEESEDALKGGALYALPEFYTRIFGHIPLPQTTGPQKAQLHAERVGEYTINTCM